MRAAVARLRTLSNGPFNLNFLVYPQPDTSETVLQPILTRLQPYYEELGLNPPTAALPALGPGFDATSLELILELHPPVVSFHFGIPEADAIAKLKAAGIVILHSATSVAEARELEASGIDAVIAQGWEAGGHRGSRVPQDTAVGVGTLALVPQIADAIKVPVIAAGGIADGRGIAAAFALGASERGCQGPAQTPDWRTRAPRVSAFSSSSAGVLRTGYRNYEQSVAPLVV